MKRSYVLVLLLAVGAVVGFGCEKKVKLAFTNRTNESLDLSITAPGTGKVDLGTLQARVGSLVYELKVDTDALPAQCNWQAGHHAGNVLISEKSPKVIPVEIRQGGPADTRDTIKRKVTVDVKDTLVEPDGAVVE